MTKTRTLGLVATAIVAILVAGVGYALATFIDERFTVGEAYGFVIGEPVSTTYERALRQQAEGEIAEIRIGKGSGALVHDPAHPEHAVSAPNWQLVVNPNWWNDSISLTFEAGQLVVIRRFRLCCELP